MVALRSPKTVNKGSTPLPHAKKDTYSDLFNETSYYNLHCITTPFLSLTSVLFYTGVAQRKSR